MVPRIEEAEIIPEGFSYYQSKDLSCLHIRIGKRCIIVRKKGNFSAEVSTPDVNNEMCVSFGGDIYCLVDWTESI